MREGVLPRREMPVRQEEESLDLQDQLAADVALLAE
jgi:hypothetical protein